MSQVDGLEITPTSPFSAVELIGGTGKLEDEGLIARLRQPEFTAPVAAG